MIGGQFVAAVSSGAVLAGIGLGFVPPAAADSWTMPNLIGMDLQGAQDAIQSLTDDRVWFSSSTDLTGQGRMQVDDRNWVVCSSSPALGVTFDETTEIDFGVVRKDSESCP